MVVVYDSKFGNTREIAQAIARGLGNFAIVQIVSVRTSHLSDLAGTDLLVVGSPTQRHGPTATMNSFLAEIPPHSMHRLRVAAFDTRYRRPKLMSGSAARSIARELRRGGCELIRQPKSFFVAGRKGPLEPGELERALRWGRSLLREFKVAGGALGHR